MSLILHKSLAILMSLALTAIGPTSASADEADRDSDCRLYGNMSRVMAASIRPLSAKKIRTLENNDEAKVQLIGKIVYAADLGDLAAMGDVRSARFQTLFNSALMQTVHQFTLDRDKTDDELAALAKQHCLENDPLKE